MTDGNERAYEGVDEAEAVAAAKKSADPTTRSVYRDGKELSRVIRLRPAATITPLERTFTLYPYIPHGELTWIEGSPRCGKTMAIIEIISRMSRGDPFVNKEPIEHGNIAILSSEDSVEYTLVPRLHAAKANLSCVSFITVAVEDEEQQIAFFEDLPGIEQRLREEKIRFLFVDGVFAFLGVKDSSSYTEAYTTMTPVVSMIRRLNIGAGVVRHTRKTGGKALDSGVGSTGYTALGRSTLTVAVEQYDPEQRIFAHAGVSGAAIGDSYTFRIEGVTLPGFTRSTGVAVWGDKIDVTADEALAQDQDDTYNARAIAEEFLRSTLHEPMAGSEVYAAAKRKSIAGTTLKHTAKSLGIATPRQGFGQGSVWYPPGWKAPAVDEHSDHSNPSRPAQYTRSERAECGLGGSTMPRGTCTEDEPKGVPSAIPSPEIARDGPTPPAPPEPIRHPLERLLVEASVDGRAW